MITTTKQKQINIKTEIPELRSFIVDRVSTLTDRNALQRICSIIISNTESYEQKFLAAKQQTEQFCTPDIAAELEADGFMIGKPFPFDDSLFDLEQAEQEDLNDEPAPEDYYLHHQ